MLVTSDMILEKYLEKRCRYNICNILPEKFRLNQTRIEWKELRGNYRQVHAGPRVILDRTNIGFHINAESTCFLPGAPNFDLPNIHRKC